MSDYQSRRDGLIDKLYALHEKTEREGRDLTAAEEREWVKMKGQLRDIDIEEEKREGKPLLDHAGMLSEDSRAQGEINRNLGGYETRSAPSGAPAGKAVRTVTGGIHARCAADLLGPEPQRDGAWKSDDEFIRAYCGGRFDDRFVRVSAGVTETVPSVGGFGIPPTMSFSVIDRMIKGSDFMPRCMMFEAKSGSMLVPAFDDSDRRFSRFGGMTAEWVAEEGTIPTSKPQFRRVEMNTRGLKSVTPISNEWLANDVASADLVVTAVHETMSDAANGAIIDGDGVGKPLGILNSACAIEVDPEQGQGAGTVLYSNIRHMYSRMSPTSRMHAIWIANNDLVPELLDLNRPLGTGGQFETVINENNGMFSLLGRPVLFTEHCPAAGERGDLAFVDFRSYGLAIRRNITIDTSPHVYFNTDQLAIRATCYIDGQSLYAKESIPKKGTLTTSPVVVLGERA